MTTEKKTHTPKPKRPWSKGEKALLGAIILVAVLVGIGALWNQHVSVMPAAAIPTPAMPARNAYDDFIAAANSEVQSRMMGYAEMGPPLPGATGVNTWPNLTTAQKAAVIQANAPMFRLVRQGLKLPYQPPLERSFGAPGPDTAKLREVDRVLLVAERVQEAQGHWNQAVNTGLDEVQFGEKLAHNSPLIGLLEGDACEGIGRFWLWQTPAHLNAAQAEVAARRLAAIQAERSPFVDTVQQDKWTNQASLLEILRKPNWRQAIGQTLSGGNPANGGALNSGFFTLSTMFLSRSDVFQDYTRSIDFQIAQAKQPYTPHPAPLPQAGDILAQGLNSDFTPYREQYAFTVAQDDLLMLTYALRAYEHDNHAYPAQLSALVPQYVAQIPRDPFAETGPLHYRLQGSHYVLYSDGPDGKDDGGKQIFDASKPKPSAAGRIDQRYLVTPTSIGDVVAGVNVGQG
jgi:hypothetical protein